MDKNRFRNISFCAIGALLALALVQAWSLWRMYADRAEEFSRKVTLAMNRAAYDDLLIGNRRRTSQTRTSVVTTGNIDSVKLDMIDTISVKSLGAAGKVLSIRSKVDTLRTNIALRRGDKTRYIYQEVRMPSFTALQFNLSRYDSLLTRYLADAGIGKPSMGSKDNATAAISALCAEYGAWAVRVHDVEKNRDAVAIGNAWRAFANV